MRPNSLLYGVLVLAIFLGTIGSAQALGFWLVCGEMATLTFKSERS